MPSGYWNRPVTTVKILKTELSIEPIRADSVILMQAQESNFTHRISGQARFRAAALPLRFLDYWVRLYRLYRMPIVQVLVLLRPPPENAEIESAFVLGTTRHEYQVLKLWEQSPDLFLNDSSTVTLSNIDSSGTRQFADTDGSSGE